MHSSRMRTVRNSSRRGGGLLQEVSALGGVPGLGGMVSQHALRQTPCGQTDRRKNITFTTSLRMVIGYKSLSTASNLASEAKK